MYYDQAVTRVNQVNWNEFGTNVSKDNGKLVNEFLRRLASFYKAECQIPKTPVYSNIAYLLGDTDLKINIYGLCNKSTNEFLEKHGYIEFIVSFYIQLAKYIDNHPEYSEYLKIYEPLLEIIESGGCFNINTMGIEIKGFGYIPLQGWYERYVYGEPGSV
ncbi:hypothetical protein [Paenibacillus sp. DCT19]|uniref:hypothetical protein n=1 Tax=Paenibacillus sp. DCT19 TaxID=2211212 RepID=UPI000FE1F3BF|nr:hypothetical protein [Paenibacillus sp. DCT19]